MVDGALHTAVFSAGALQQGEGIGPEVERATAVLVVAVVVVVVVEKCGRLSGRPAGRPSGRPAVRPSILSDSIYTNSRSSAPWRRYW